MAEGMNGALLALGVVGAVALAGRVARGSFARDWRHDARHLLALSEEEEEVDSGDLSDPLERIVEDRSVTGYPRAHAARLLLDAQEEGYLDTGDALGAIQEALQSGSRAIYGMGPDAAGRTLRLGFGKPRSNAGEALNDYRWHPQRALAQFAASKKKGKGKGGSRAYGSIENEISVIDPVTKKKKLLKRHEGESGPEFMGRVWVEIEEWLTGKRLGKPAAGTEVLIWANRGHRMRAHPSSYVDYERYVATGQPYSNRWEYAGRVKGSRAFTLDDPEYTHYVVHTPSMKIASGWSYAEDAKEALSDMGMAKSHCKVYTRKYLRDDGRDPRHNGNWASRGQF